MGGPGSGHWRHAGRKGKKGGSAPSGASTILSLNSNARYTNIDGIPVLNINQQLVSDISQKSGVDERQVYNMMDEWLGLATGDYLGLSIQKDAGEVFEVGIPKYISDKLTAAQQSSRELASKGFPRRSAFEVSERGTTSESRRRVLGTIYSNTQDKLKALGFKQGDTVRLHRGVNSPSIREHTPLESFTSSKDIAKSYATGASQGITYTGSSKGYVATIDVPIESIFSVYGTGFGDAASKEFVVIGNYE